MNRTLSVLVLAVALVAGVPEARGAEDPPPFGDGGLLGIGLQAAPATAATSATPEVEISYTAACSRKRAVSYRPPRIRPAPAASAEYIARLTQRYGLISIDGSRATIANLQRMDDVFSKFARGCFRNLKITFERDRRWGGFWCPVDHAGSDIIWDNDPDDQAPAFAAGHIYYLEDPVTRWIFTHELAHHVTIYAEPSLGRDLLQAFGQRITNPTVPREFSRLLNFNLNVSPEYAPMSMYPTAYARDNNVQEHMAELVSYRYEHPDRQYNDPILRTFRMPPLPLALIEATFGGVRANP
jgi:hypothetical protein